MNLGAGACGPLDSERFVFEEMLAYRGPPRPLPRGHRPTRESLGSPLTPFVHLALDYAAPALDER